MVILNLPGFEKLILKKDSAELFCEGEKIQGCTQVAKTALLP